MQTKNKNEVLLYPENIKVEMGSHVILLYKDKTELVEFLGKYFYEGIKNNDICILIGENITFVDVQKEIQNKNGISQDELSRNVVYVDYKGFYLTNGQFHSKEIFEKIDGVFSKYPDRTIRVTGDGSWVDKKNFNDFYQYEVEVSKKYNDKNVVIVCTYLSKQLSIEQVIKLTQSHAHILFKEGSSWNISETVEREIYEKQINKLEEFTSFTVGRELKMVELKTKIKQLEKIIDDLKK